MRALALSSLAPAALSLLGCLSAPPLTPDAFIGTDDLYALELQGFFPTRIEGGAFDRVYRNRQGSLFVGVVLDGPPASLDDLDDAVEKNLANASYDRAQVTDVEVTSLGGLKAHESRIHFTIDGRPFTMVNVHTSTENENVQLVVWGVGSQGHRVRSLVKDLIGGGFRFLSEVLPFAANGPVDLDDPNVPVLVRGLPQGWRPAGKGQLNDRAAVELIHQSRSLFMIGIVERAEEIPFDAMKAVLQANLAKALVGGRGGELPFDETGSGDDVVWSQSGLLDGDDELAVTYRIRLLKQHGRFLHAYCWGETGSEGLTETCDELLSALVIRRE